MEKSSAGNQSLPFPHALGAANGTEFTLIWRGGRFQILTDCLRRVSVYPKNPAVRRVTLSEEQIEIVWNAAARPFHVAAAAASSKLASSQIETNDQHGL